MSFEDKQEIYELYDPRNEAIQYIGYSKDAKQRYKQHLQRKQGDNYQWMQEVVQDGLMPGMRILETVQGVKVAKEREKYWIQIRKPLNNWTHNQEALRQRSSERAINALLAEEFAYLPEEKSQQMIELIKKGLAHAGHGAWNSTFDIVGLTVQHLEQIPGFGLDLDEIAIAKLSLKILGFSSTDESEEAL